MSSAAWDDPRTTLALDLYPKLLYLAYNLTATREDAEDAVQECYLRCLYKLDTLRSDDAVKPYCYRVLRNTVIDLHRSATKRDSRRPERKTVEQVYLTTFLGGESVAGKEGEDTPEALLRYEDHDLRIALIDTLQLVPAAQVTVLLALYYAGFTAQEWSVRSGLPVRTIYHQSDLARNKFRTLWEQVA